MQGEGDTVMASSAYPLWGLLFCRCGQPCRPVESVDGSRAYASLCGCRMAPVDADIVERLVLNAAEREALALFTNLPAERHAEAYRKVFAQIIVGGTADDIAYVPRT